MRPFGAESVQKIARHRKLREKKGFLTFERYTNVAGLALPERGTALLECVCNLAANEMFDEQGEICAGAEDAVLGGIAALERTCGDLIVVTNDVGSDDGAYPESTRAYIELVGRVNRALAARFECVCELVCGIPLVVKGELPIEITNTLEVEAQQ